MPLGAHLPTSKGLSYALAQAQELHCSCLQIFSKSPRQWNAAPLDAVKTAHFRDVWRASGFWPLVVHDSYLINLAAPDEVVREKSIAAMIDEVERAEALGCDFLVTHCGAHLSRDCVGGEEAGLKRLGQSLERVLERTLDVAVRIALENTAAQGTCLGGPFEHLDFVLREIGSQRLCVCFDTCHAFAAGHDLSTPLGVEEVFANFDRIVGLDKLAIVHLNDSKGALGKHLDRHEHIGEGAIGREAMSAILTHPQLRDLPFILETPDVETMIAANLQTVRELRGELLNAKEDNTQEISSIDAATYEDPQILAQETKISTRSTIKKKPDEKRRLES
jgi:deoxyribonuclease-4